MTDMETSMVEPDNFDLESFRKELARLMETNHQGKDNSPDYLIDLIARTLKTVSEKEVPVFIAMVNQSVSPSLFQRMFWSQVIDVSDADQPEAIRQEIGKAFANGVTSWEARSGVRLG